MEYYPFDSGNPLYKSKIGAVADGTPVELRLLLHQDARVWEAFLVLQRDGEEPMRLPMEAGESLEAYRFYSRTVTLPEGLYWYHFLYTSDYGEFKVMKGEHTLGIVTNDGACFQQTVYRRDFVTPEWLDGGIIYQIFPDRFAASGEVKAGVPADRYLQKDWFAQPAYRQTSEPRRLGNDYYGGDFKGIEQRLDDLAALGVNCIYLNPVFEAHSNHRYNTADYFRIDPLLGTEEDLESLIRAAAERKIYLILDGVFSHTGDDSVYFNREGRYDSVGAYESEASPYWSWYRFGETRDDYACWWGVPSLPETNEEDAGFDEFINGENGVIRTWLRKGIRGWRLDVADELPDAFLDHVRAAVKAEGQENFLLGEVWEDATNKISYGSRRRFLRGAQLDSVMNYPFANAIIRYLKGGNARDLMDSVLEILEHYPPQAIKLLMNHIGTHDTARAITRLGCGDEIVGDREAQARRQLTQEEYETGKRRLMMAAVLQFTLPGVPSIYYGDEAGLTGFGDPFCRAAYPWDAEDLQLRDFYRRLGQFRRSSATFRSGSFVPIHASFGEIVYAREKGTERVLVAVNRWCEPARFTLPEPYRSMKPVFGSSPQNGVLTVAAESFCILH